MEEWNHKQIICRVCLSDTGQFQTIFTSVELKNSQEKMHLSEMICSFSNVQMTLGDGLPEQICVNCAQETLKMYAFKTQCEDSDKFLRKRLLLFTEDNSFPQENSEVIENTKNLHDTDVDRDILDSFDKDFDFDYATNISDSDDFKDEFSETVTSQKPKEYECNICLKRFTRGDLLLRHKIAHAMKMEEFKDIESDVEEDNETDNITDDNTSQQESENIQKSDVLPTYLNCDLCKNNFVKIEDFEKHFEEHIAESKGISEKTDMIVVNPENCPPLFLCSLCNSIFVSDDKFQHHLEKHLKIKNDGSTTYTCKVCSKTIENMTDFKKHIKEYHERVKYSCPHCFVKYSKEGHLKNHLKYHKDKLNKEVKSDKEGYLCNHCKKIFRSKGQLNAHYGNIALNKKLSSKKKPHVCEICFKAFNQLSNLKDHIRTHNGEKPFLCPTCGKGFNQLGNLRQHQVRHSGVKSHVCSTCGSGFASKGELDAHLRKHTGARPFICDTCGNGFTTSSSLTKHKRIHSGEKPYECDYCNMKFSRSGILSRHRRIHTGEKPYVCKYCKKAFTQSNDLKSHLRIHTGEKPYICDECGQPFRQSSALRSHKKTHLGQNGSKGTIGFQKVLVKEEEKVFVEPEQIFIIP